MYDYNPHRRWMSYEKFVQSESLSGIFNLNMKHERNFIKNCLLKYKPRDNDHEGWLYVYYPKIDDDLFKQKKLSHLILFKVGRTKNTPEQRVSIQSNKNNEVYIIKETFRSKFHCYLEFAVHWMFGANRVVRPDLKDGKTEWFLMTF